jgi:hypothetical protein
LWFQAIKRGFALLLLVTVFTAGIANSFYRPFELYIARTKTAQVYNRAEYELVNAGNLPMARRLFEEIYPYSKEGILIEAWLAGMNYLEGNYAQAIIDSCVWLTHDASDIPDYDAIAPSLVTTVHWSLYQLAHTRSFSEALTVYNQLLLQVTEPYSKSRCVVDEELSPLFLGISPANRAFMLELPKYAPPPFYTYLGILSGHPERYLPPEEAIVDDVDRQILTWLASTLGYGLGGRDDQGDWHFPKRYAHWAAFLIGDYDHQELSRLRYTEEHPPESRRYEENRIVAAAMLARAVSGLGSEPAMGIARLNAYMDPRDSYARILLYEDSPWLDDIYALMMYLWSQQGNTDRALDCYSELSKLDKYDVQCRFCNPGSVFGLSMTTVELEELVASRDSRIDFAICNPPYLMDLLGLRQLAEGRYDDARATFEQLGQQCVAKYPGMEANDYLNVVSLLEAIGESPTKANYQRYFVAMDQSWTWDLEQDIPLPETWSLQRAFYRTHNWPVEVFLQVNPWVTYAQLLEEYADRFAQDVEHDVRVPASLLQAAWIYDVLSAYPGEMLDEDAQKAYTLQLRDRAVGALEHYLELYYERRDIPPQFCRYYRGDNSILLNYNVVQDCTIEWLSLLHLGAHQEEDMIERYDEQDIIAMQEQARKLIVRYPEHHLANNLLSWIAWGYAYRANLYTIYSGEYRENYRNALYTYQELLDRYPSGDQAANAQENIYIIEEKLRSPEARRRVPEGRWTWDVAEKTAPQLEDFLR